MSCPVGIDGGPTPIQSPRFEESLAVNSLVEYLRAVVSGLSGRLDQEMGPERICLTRQFEPLSDEGRSQDQVALRVRRRGPHVVTPGPGPKGLHPISLWTLEVLHRVLPGTHCQEFVAELSAVYRLPAALGERPKYPGHPWATDLLSGPG
jgi:hypothetical protein